MDKRLFSLNVFISMTIIFCLASVIIDETKNGVLVDLLPLMLPVALCISWFSHVAIFGAIADMAKRRVTTDERYFTRCFLYKTFCIPFFFFYLISCILIFTLSLNIFLIWMYMFLPGVIYFAFALMMASSFHVIAGLSDLRKQGLITRGEFVLHLILQLFFVIDVFDALYLFIREKNRYPNARTSLLRKAFAPRQIPVPGLMGANLVAIFCALLAATILIAVMRIALGDAVLANFDTYETWIIVIIVMTGLFTFMILLCLRVIFDAAYYWRSPPLAVRERSFCKKLLFYSSVAFAVEVLLALLTIMIINMIGFSSDSTSLHSIATPYIFLVFISVCILLHTGVFLYTRLALKRSLADAVISREKAVKLTALSLLPGIQIAVVVLLLQRKQSIRSSMP